MTRRRVAFGLIPLGSIRGRVVRDLNGNGIADSTEPAIEGAVVVLDGGKRSERSKRGQYAFEAVQSGEHTVTLLADSLPDGALIAGEATQIATLGRERHGGRGAVSSCRSRRGLKSEKCFRDPRSAHCRNPEHRRAEMEEPHRRRVHRPTPAVAKSEHRRHTAAAHGSHDGNFRASDRGIRRPHRARQMVVDLLDKGLPAFLLEPPAERPNAPYRVRVGLYASRIDARARLWGPSPGWWAGRFG